MTPSTTWLVANDRHLEASLAVLRLRLERLAEELGSTDGPVVLPVPDGPDLSFPAPMRGTRRRSWRGSAESRPEPATVQLPAGPPPALPGRDLAAELTAAEEAVREAEDGIFPPPALVSLAQAFGLGRFARDLLLLAAAPELDPGIGPLLAAVHGQPWPTYALAARVLDNPDWESRSTGGPLRRWRLVAADESGGVGLSTCRLSVDERILDAMKGLHQLDGRLAGLLVTEPVATGPLPPSQLRAVEEAVQAVETAPGESAVYVVQLVGASAAGRRSIAGQVAAAFGGDLHRLQPRLLPTAAEELEQLARLWHREVLLHSPVLLLDEGDGDLDGPAGAPVEAFLARTGGLVIVGGSEVVRALPGVVGVVEVTQPTTDEQLDLWRAALADATAPEDGDDAEDAGIPDTALQAVVEQFDLDQATIQAVGALARARGGIGAEELWDTVRRHRRPRLDSAAQRIDPVATWEDLVLPEDRLAQLWQVVSQVRNRHRVHRDWGFAARMNRGLGVSALFAGESGTGKSMSAEVLARELDLDLYRIDLSAVVSKYIGETEKNLRRLFDAAEGGGVILFFDEADALFGKRSEVKDAHDRYANIETNYLLQRMEGYRGLAILATNMRSAIDKAFCRRMRFVVEFPFPTRENREAMWARAFPPEADVGELDPARLARIDLTGAGIASAALSAAFRAAAEGRAVATDDVLQAARDELRKLQRPVPEAQFRPPLVEGRAS